MKMKFKDLLKKKIDDNFIIFDTQNGIFRYPDNKASIFASQILKENPLRN